MYVRRNIRWSLIAKFGWVNVTASLAWAFAVTLGHELFAGTVDLSLPFLPIGTVGTAVAIMIGFKNSQAYERFWEARKLWGGIVNTSRQWANQVITYLGPGDDAKRLILRQVAWVNTLRLQLRKTTIFDRENLAHTPHLDLGTVREDGGLAGLISPEEQVWLCDQRNGATQLLRRQGDELAALRETGRLGAYESVSMMDTLGVLYDLQGGCERIKNTPLPRQFAYFSAVFVRIFAALLPFGLVDTFAEHGRVWLTVPFSALISWIFVTMEVVGDSSEDPFENYVNDVPMTAISRTIEIDLRQMLGEADLPPKPVAVNDVLM